MRKQTKRQKQRGCGSKRMARSSEAAEARSPQRELWDPESTRIKAANAAKAVSFLLPPHSRLGRLTHPIPSAYADGYELSPPSRLGRFTHPYRRLGAVAAYAATVIRRYLSSPASSFSRAFFSSASRFRSLESNSNLSPSRSRRVFR